MDEQQDRVSVEIFGKRYIFAVDDDHPPEQIERVAALVNEMMRQVAAESPNRPALQTAVLAGFNLTDELLRLRADFDKAENHISQRTSRLAASLGRLVDERIALSGRAAPVEKTSVDGNQD